MSYKEDDKDQEVKNKFGIFDKKKVPHKHPLKRVDNSESGTDWPSGISDDEKDRLRAKRTKTMETQYGKSWRDRYVSNIPRFQKGNALFTSTKDGQLKEWSIKRNELVFDFGKVHKAAIKGLVVNYDETFLFTSSYDKHIKQFCLVTKSLIRDYGECHDLFIETICFSKCGTYLFSGGDDKILRQFELSDNMLKLRYEYELDLPPFMLSTASNTRVFYAVVGYQGHVYRWNIIDENTKTDKVKQELEELETSTLVKNMTFSNVDKNPSGGLGLGVSTQPANKFNSKRFFHNLKVTSTSYKEHAIHSSMMSRSKQGKN